MTPGRWLRMVAFRVLITYLQPVLPAMAAEVESFLNIPALRWDAIDTPLTGIIVFVINHVPWAVSRPIACERSRQHLG